MADLAAREAPRDAAPRRAQDVGRRSSTSPAPSTRARGPRGPLGDAWVYEDKMIYVHKRFVAIPLDGDPGRRRHRRSTARRCQMTARHLRRACARAATTATPASPTWSSTGSTARCPFPTFPRFCGQTFHESRRPRARAGLRAGLQRLDGRGVVRPSGGMNIPLCIIPLWDPELAAAETQRNADRGVRAICFSEMPTTLRLPSIHTGYWDPLFAGVQRHGRHRVHAHRVVVDQPGGVARRARAASAARWRSTTRSPRWPTGCSPASSSSSRS